MQKKPRERIIFDNYDVSARFDEAKKYLIEEGNEDSSDDDVWEEVYFQEDDAWECEKGVLKSVFDKEMFLAVGVCGRWDGSFAGGFTFDSWDSDKRSERQIHEKLFEDSHYSHLIHFAHRMYGCPIRETA